MASLIHNHISNSYSKKLYEKLIATALSHTVSIGKTKLRL